MLLGRPRRRVEYSCGPRWGEESRGGLVGSGVSPVVVRGLGRRGGAGGWVWEGWLGAADGGLAPALDGSGDAREEIRG
jgi:hypothetical protein